MKQSSLQGFSRQEYWSGLSCPQGIFPTQGSNPYLLHLLHWQVDSLSLVPSGKPLVFSLSLLILSPIKNFLKLKLKATRDMHKLPGSPLITSLFFYLCVVFFFSVLDSQTLYRNVVNKEYHFAVCECVFRYIYSHVQLCNLPTRLLCPWDFASHSHFKTQLRGHYLVYLNVETICNISCVLGPPPSY